MAHVSQMIAGLNANEKRNLEECSNRSALPTQDGGSTNEGTFDECSTDFVHFAFKLFIPTALEGVRPATVLLNFACSH